LTALRENPAALTFVDNDLGKDKDFLIEAINSPRLFKYMDKTLLEDQDFMQKIKEVKGFTPNIENEDKPVAYRESLVEVNASLAKEIAYKYYENYQMHSSSWNSAVDITENQKYLISASGSKINVWDVNSTLLFKQIDIHKDIRDLALVDDGKSVLTLSSKEIKIWDLERGVVKKVLYKGDAHIWRMSLSVNRKWLAFFDENHMVRIYNLERGVKTQSFKVNTEGSLIFTIDNDAKYLAWGTYFSSDITLWEIHISRKVATFEGNFSDLSALHFAPNNNYLVSADSDGYINIWDIKRKKLLRTLVGNQRNIKSLDISSDGKWLLSASYNIEVWNFETGVYFKMFPISNKQRGYAKFINKNREILSYGHDNSIVIRELASAKVTKEFKSLKRTAYLLKFTPDKKHMLMAFREGDAHSKVAIWDIEKNRLLKVLESNNSQKVSALEVSQDSRYLFIAYGWGDGGGANIHIEMWDMKKNKLLKRFKNMNDKASDRENIFELVLSPDGQYLVSYLNSGIEKYKGVELWSVERGELISFVPSFEKSSRSPFIISQDSRWLIVGDEKGKIKFWNIAQSRFMKSEQITQEPIDKITLFSKDKLLIASGKKIYLRSLKEHRNIRVFNTKETPIHQIIALKNRDVFITESLSSRLNIWSLYQDKPLYALELNHCYADMGLVIDLSSNGQKVIIGFDDGTAKLYTIDKLNEAEKIFVFGDKENWAVFDEVNKKMTLSDKGDFLLKKEQVYKDKSVTVFTYKPSGL
jgi:WD40 repeat protein